MSDLGYKPVFDAAESLANITDYTKFFPTFRDHPELFHFIVANTAARRESDRNAVEQAEGIDPDFFKSLVAKGPSHAGGSSAFFDAVESRHLLMMTFLYSKIGSDWGNVVEIGGGYGNCLRLVSGLVTYKSWTIVDLGYILDLQKWFLIEEEVDITNVRFLRAPEGEPTVVMGTHSLSEFSLDDFSKYFEFIKTAKWFFYVSQSNAPDYDLLQKKMAMVLGEFDLVDSRKYEAGTSIMYFFEKK